MQIVKRKKETDQPSQPDSSQKNNSLYICDKSTVEQAIRIPANYHALFLEGNVSWKLVGSRIPANYHTVFLEGNVGWELVATLPLSVENILIGGGVEPRTVANIPPYILTVGIMGNVLPSTVKQIPKHFKTLRISQEVAAEAIRKIPDHISELEITGNEEITDDFLKAMPDHIKKISVNDWDNMQKLNSIIPHGIDICYLRPPAPPAPRVDNEFVFDNSVDNSQLIPSLSKFVKHYNMVAIRLNRVSLDERTMAFFIRFLHHSRTTLKELALSHNSISDNKVLELFLKGLTVLNLRAFSFNDNRITSSGLQKLSEVLKKHPNLQSLELSNLGGYEASTVSNLARDLPKLERLRFGFRLEVKLIKDLLTNASRLQELDLERGYVCARGMKALASALANKSTTLKTLHLPKCHDYTKPMYNHLCDLIQRSHGLETLTITGEFPFKVDNSKLANALKKNRSLLSLKVLRGDSDGSRYSTISILKSSTNILHYREMRSGETTPPYVNIRDLVSVLSQNRRLLSLVIGGDVTPQIKGNQKIYFLLWRNNTYHQNKMVFAEILSACIQEIPNCFNLLSKDIIKFMLSFVPLVNQRQQKEFREAPEIRQHQVIRVSSIVDRIYAERRNGAERVSAERPDEQQPKRPKINQ